MLSSHCFRSTVFGCALGMLVVLRDGYGAQPKLHLEPSIKPPATSNEVTSLPATTQSTNSTTAVAVPAAAPGSLELDASMQIQAYENTVAEFGREFANAFYVGEVTVINNAEDPVLVYSSSLRATVFFISQNVITDASRINRA